MNMKNFNVWCNSPRSNVFNIVIDGETIYPDKFEKIGIVSHESIAETKPTSEAVTSGKWAVMRHYAWETPFGVIKGSATSSWKPASSTSWRDDDGNLAYAHSPAGFSRFGIEWEKDTVIEFYKEQLRQLCL